MKKYGVFLNVFLIGVAAVCIFEYINAINEKNELLQTLSKVEKHASSLEQERSQLLEDLDEERQLNTQLSNNLKITQDKLESALTNLQGVQKLVEDLTAQLGVSKAENLALRSELDVLKVIKQERDELLAKFNSIPELKKAIRELRQKFRGFQPLSSDSLGNKGYIIKDGKSTYPTKVKIEVQPLPEQK